MRSSFDSFDRPAGNYLLNHSVGIPPASTRGYVNDRLMSDWLSAPAEAWDRWMAELNGFHAELGRLGNHEPAWFCHQANVSSAVTKIIHALPFDRSRPVILLPERAFPSLGFVAQAAGGVGYQLRMIPRDAQDSDAETWQRWLTDDVGIALVPHVLSNVGTQLPVAAILEQARIAGVVSVVDVAQSAGVLPIDLRTWQADFIVGTSVKWLCGGPGSGFLWVNPDIIDRCRPLDVGWFSHEAPFEFDINNFRLAPDARRFWGGTPAPISAAIARLGIAAINDIGVPEIREHNLTLTQRLIDAVDDHVLVSPQQPAHRSGTVVLHPDPEARNAAVVALTAAGVQIDERDEGLRISPHVINTLEDIDAVVAVLAGS